MIATKVLHTEKALAPKLRFKGFTEVWEKRSMGDLGSFMGGGTPTTSVEKYWIGDIPWISSSDLFEDDLNSINIHRYLNKDAISESATKVIPKNSVLLISRVGVGKLAVNKTELCTSQDFSNFIPNESDSYFIAYFLLARKNLLINFAQGTSIKGFTTSDIKSLKVSIPTLPEQQKIASFLSAVDEKIQQLTRKKELLEQYKKGVMQQLFSGKLRFKDENGKAFAKWQEKRLGDVVESISSGKSKNSDDGSFLLYGSTGVIGKCQDFSHDGVFILIARVGANAGTINLVKGKFGVSDNTLVVICNAQLNLGYLYFYLRFYNLNKLIFGSGQPLITGGQLKDLNLHLPSLTEQKKIANYLSNMDTKIESVNKQITQTQTFKKGLLQQMFV